jgi:hypothetical protein
MPRGGCEVLEVGRRKERELKSRGPRVLLTSTTRVARVLFGVV